MSLVNQPAIVPYDRVCFTAVDPAVQPPLLAQLAPGGRRIGSVGQSQEVQDLVLMIRQDSGEFQHFEVGFDGQGC